MAELRARTDEKRRRDYYQRARRASIAASRMAWLVGGETAYNPTSNLLGGSTFLSRGAGLTGASDGKAFTLSVLTRIADLTSIPRFIQNDLGATNFRVRINTDGSIEVTASSPPTTVGVLNITTAAGTIAQDELVHLYMGFNLADPAQRFIRKNGVDQTLTVTTYTDSLIDMTAGDWFVGANQSGVASFNGEIADYQLAFSFIDDLERFFKGGKPVKPDPAGMIVLFQGSWDGTNDGTGGDFSVTGTIQPGDEMRF